MLFEERGQEFVGILDGLQGQDIGCIDLVQYGHFGVELGICGKGIVLQVRDLHLEIRNNAANLQMQIANLQNDSLSDDPDLNTEVSVLNKINAANVLTLQSVQDSNKLLASLLEQQLITSKQQREMTANRIDTDITRQATLAANMNQLTGTLANSLQNFRMP